ncbi:MAG TPA: DnaJ C-terminal domain-containing protein [Candidatus Dormibacteraeota bacterium]|nr:DnaJ C-terminal domain-containing protein [Candidatus Dormibacteraeota bacterium]
MATATGFKDYYATLGVPPGAPQKDIRSAYRKLARQHHPDVNPGDSGAEARFKEINEAHEVLSDAEKRAQYDEMRERWQRGERWQPAGAGGGGSAGGGGAAGAGYSTMSAEDLEDLFGNSSPFSDFFNDFFARGTGAAGGAASGTRTRTRTRAQRGEDVEAETEIGLDEAYSGTTRTVEFGDGRRIEVRIPPGIRDGARVRAAGQGGAGRGEGASGDLYVRVRIRPHPRFRRDGDDLTTRVEVPLDVALLGGEVPVPTLRGTTAQLRIPPGTQNGARLRLRGLGMPRLRGGGNGDLIAEVDVRLPSRITPELQRLAEGLRGQRETANA